LEVAYQPGTNDVQLGAIKEAVCEFAAKLTDVVSEPDEQKESQWRSTGVKHKTLCDEPCPDGVLLTECPVGWLLERANRYHVRLVLTRDDPPKLEYVPHHGRHKYDCYGVKGMVRGVVPLMPRWFTDACRRRSQEIINFLKANSRVVA
jgi:hypothetical protein